ncbi:hypothetical protein PINS_up021123 [Pythium insidiosum]|nr:hypothetical protein PINS_up021123 [Pythium insidiosum]
MDAVKGEAERGAIICPACQFGNFARQLTCVLCGSTLEQTSLRSVVVPRRVRWVSLLDDGNGTMRLMVFRFNSMRTEWQRRLDVQGRLYWFRAAVDEYSTKQRSDGFVVVFEQQLNDATDILPATQQTQPDGSRSDKNNQEAPSIPPFVRSPKATFRMRLIAARDADPSRFPHSRVNVDTTELARDAIRCQDRQFPSKFSHFVISSSILNASAAHARMHLTLRREYILEHSMELLVCIPDRVAQARMRISFRGESGIDAGGLHREWFMLLNEMLTKPHVGLFKCTNRADQTYYINANSAVDNGDDHLVFFFGAGRMVGRALLDGAVLGFHLSVPLLKLILGVPVTFDDLEYYDAQLYRNLKWLLENDGVDELGLDFSVCEQRGFGRRSSDTDAVGTDGAIPTDSNNATADVETVVVDLIPNGRHVSVTDENKALYVDRRFKYVLFESVWEQLCVFLRGVYDVIPVELLVGFDYEELDYLLCGTGEIDVDDWEQHTRISLNLEDNPRVLRWFWELVREMDGEARRRLLHFSTGSSRVSLVGFKGLTSYDGRLCPFTLKGVAFVTDQYIRSHACFNMLDLPLYRTKEEMRLALYGLLDSDMYGFTTA